MPQARIAEVIHERLVVPPPVQRHAGLERRLITHLDLEAHGKSESCADGVEVIVARQQRDPVDDRVAAEVHLHPFHRVLQWRQRTMVSVIGARVALLLRGGLRCAFDAPRERRELLARHFFQRLLDCGERGVRIALLVRQLHKARVQRVVGVVFPLGMIERGEDGLQRVVVLLRDGIELVVVALRAMDGGAAKSAGRIRHHVVAIEVARDFAVHFCLRHFEVPDRIPRPRCDEAERLDAVVRAGKKHVSRDLLLHETRVGLVVVERADDIVAIRPCIRAQLVLVIAVRVAVVDDVEPVPRPALAVARGGEQLVHEPLVGIRRMVGGKGGDLLRRRRESGEVEVKTAAECARVGFGRHREFFLCELCGDEGVYRISAQCPVLSAQFFGGCRRVFY